MKSIKNNANAKRNTKLCTELAMSSFCQLMQTSGLQIFCTLVLGYLGRKVRVVVPACVVLKIRRELPDTQGQYLVFRAALG